MLCTVTGIVSWLTLRFNFLFDFGDTFNFGAMELQARSQISGPCAPSLAQNRPSKQRMWNRISSQCGKMWMQ